MDAGAVLERLAELGVAVTVKPNGNLWLQPASVIPADVLEAVRAGKAQIVAALSRRRVPPDTGLAPLLARLRAGQAWLVAHYDAYMDGLEPEGPYVASLIAWDTLEKLLRTLYHFEGCICESGACAPEAPVWCSACAEARPWRHEERP